jgi:lincosamide nucleotidyltransferase A/C/D/E
MTATTTRLRMNPMRKDDPEMTASDVVDIVQLLTQNHIDVCIDGGWGVDALLAEQTRTHSDLDIAVPHRDVPQVRALLEERGYKDVPRDDTRDCNFVLGDSQGHQIDVHSYTFDSAGNHVYGVEYPADSLTGTETREKSGSVCVTKETKTDDKSIPMKNQHKKDARSLRGSPIRSRRKCLARHRTTVPFEKVCETLSGCRDRLLRSKASSDLIGEISHRI